MHSSHTKHLVHLLHVRVEEQRGMCEGRGEWCQLSECLRRTAARHSTHSLLQLGSSFAIPASCLSVIYIDRVFQNTLGLFTALSKNILSHVRFILKDDPLLRLPPASSQEKQLPCSQQTRWARKEPTNLFDVMLLPL